MTEGTPLEPWARTLAAVIGGATGQRAGRFAATEVPAGQTRMSTTMMRDALPEDLTEYRRLGPQAMTLDASPSMTGLAQGVVVSPGQQKNLVTGALRGHATPAAAIASSPTLRALWGHLKMRNVQAVDSAGDATAGGADV